MSGLGNKLRHIIEDVELASHRQILHSTHPMQLQGFEKGKGWSSKPSPKMPSKGVAENGTALAS